MPRESRCAVPASATLQLDSKTTEIIIARLDWAARSLSLPEDQFAALQRIILKEEFAERLEYVQPTEHTIGTVGKISAMTMRAACRQPLSVRGDAGQSPSGHGYVLVFRLSSETRAEALKEARHKLRVRGPGRPLPSGYSVEAVPLPEPGTGEGLLW